MDKRENVNRVIRGAMAREGMVTQTELAGYLGITQQTIGYKFRRGWHDFELWDLDRVLHFTPEECTRLVKGR